MSSASLHVRTYEKKKKQNNIMHVTVPHMMVVCVCAFVYVRVHFVVFHVRSCMHCVYVCVRVDCCIVIQSRSFYTVPMVTAGSRWTLKRWPPG